MNQKPLPVPPPGPTTLRSVSAMPLASAVVSSSSSSSPTDAQIVAVLERMSKPELEQLLLLNDDSYFLDVVQRLMDGDDEDAPSTNDSSSLLDKSASDPLRIAQEQTYVQAERNLALEEPLATARKDLAQAQDDYRMAHAELASLLDQQRAALSGITRESHRCRLEDGLRESEEQSEAVVAAFLGRGGTANNGNGTQPAMNADDFLKAYREARAVYHSRQHKLEAMP